VYATFDEYSTRYQHVRMERRDGVLLVQLHSGGGPLVWGDSPHTELGYAFEDIGRDVDNRVVVLTGTGGEFIAQLDTSWIGTMTPAKWDKIYQHGKRLLDNLLDIEVPVIAAVNGPATVHAELAVLADIVIASDTAVFRDAPHFRFGTVPSDGVHVVWPMVLGPNRGRYFLLTGQRLSAAEAKELGVVAEVHEPAALLDRAWELGAQLARQPDMCLRYTRVAITRLIRQLMADHVGYGLALEGLAAYESWPTG
jgi:enoyl-CoA hydratase/carnithine racemase